MVVVPGLMNLGLPELEIHDCGIAELPRCWARRLDIGRISRAHGAVWVCSREGRLPALGFVLENVSALEILGRGSFLLVVSCGSNLDTGDDIAMLVSLSLSVSGFTISTGRRWR